VTSTDQCEEQIIGCPWVWHDMDSIDTSKR
jgi:hypothetical protein